MQLQGASPRSPLELRRRHVLRLHERQDEPSLRPPRESHHRGVESAQRHEMLQNDVDRRASAHYHHRLQPLLAARVENVGSAQPGEADRPRRAGSILGHAAPFLRSRHQHALSGRQGRRKHSLLRGDGVLALPALPVLLHRLRSRSSAFLLFSRASACFPRRPAT